MGNKITVDLKTIRKEVKTLGYKVKTKTCSAFITASLIHIESGAVLSGFSGNTGWSDSAREQHKKVIDYLSDKSIVADLSFSGSMRVIF